MARIRTIKPEFPQSESMGRVGREARLLFVMLWTICDDEGKSRAASRMLASLLFPYDDDAPTLIEGWLSELEREGCIVRYEVEGSTYLQIDKWLKHQKIDKPSPSRLPPFTEISRNLAKPRERSSPDLVPSILDLGSGPSSLRSDSRYPKKQLLTLPDWLPKEAWDAFKEMRTKIRAPLTDKASKMIFTKLDEFRASGQDPSAILNQSTERAWRGVFQIEGRYNGNGRDKKPTAHDKFFAATASLIDEFGANPRDDESSDGASGAPSRALLPP